MLKCYERYGPGPLSPAEESRFWAESRIAAELADLQAVRRPSVARRGAAVLRRRSRPTVHFRTCRPRNALPVVDAARPRRATVGGQQNSGTGRDRDTAEMDAAHGQLRPARRGRRRGDTGCPGAGCGHCRRTTLARCWRWRAASVPETAEVLAQHLTAGQPALRCTVTPAEARERLSRTRVTTDVLSPSQAAIAASAIPDSLA